MSNFDATADKIINQLSAANVDLIFGKSREFEGKVVIPVGKIAYGWGGGSGRNETKEKIEHKEEQENEGTGLGMGVKVTPMGFITVTATSVKYSPVVDMTPIMYVGAIFVGMAILKMSKMCMYSKFMGKKHKCCQGKKPYAMWMKGMMHKKHH